MGIKTSTASPAAVAAAAPSEEPIVHEVEEKDDGRPLRLFVVSPSRLGFTAGGEVFKLEPGANEITTSPDGKQCELGGQVAPEGWDAKGLARHAQAALFRAHDVKVVESKDVPA